MPNMLPGRFSNAIAECSKNALFIFNDREQAFHFNWIEKVGSHF